MHVTKLEMYGFKSFADRVELAFEPGVSGIVGPNGSGKSNISDAVRWVLGEQNARMLRGGRMEDVIFGGTAKRRALAYCEVALTFDNGDGTLDSPYAEITISRRLYRTGESEYAINRNPCRMKDIVSLFRDTGVGKEGYSIIGQGRIDDILSPRSEDRRAVFEDAAGIAGYNARKEEAQRKLNATGQNLLRIEDILEELNDQIGPLEAQSQDARRYLAIRDQLKDLEINQILHQIDRDGQRAREGQAQLAALAERETELEDRLGRVGETLKKDASRRELAEDALSRLQDRATEETRKAQALEGDLRLMEQSILHARQEGQRLQAEGGEAAGEVQRMQRELAAYQDSLVGGRGQRAALEEELAALGAQHDEVAAQADAGEAVIEAGKTARIENLNRLSDVRSRAARAQAMQLAIEQRKAEVLIQQQTAGQEREKTQGELAAAGEVAARVRNDFEALRRQEEEAGARMQRARIRLDESRDALRRQREEVAATEARLKLLTDMKADYEGYQHSVRRLLADVSRDARLRQGLRGAVAELIDVPGRYVRAVEIALGNALQNIVTETEEDARRLIDHLRARQYGRATFLPLSAIRGRTLSPQERGTLSLPGVLGVAAELIGCHADYKNILESLLGRTVIVQDMDAAIALMRANRHSLRAVTLEGDMMNPGGSMTGGSIQGRTAGILSRENEMADQKQRLAAGKKALEAGLAERQRLEGQIAGLEEEMSLFREQCHQQEIALAREEETENRLRLRMEQVEEAALRCAEELEQLADNLSDVQEELREADRLQQAMERQEQDTVTGSGDNQAAYQALRKRQAELADSISNKRMLLMGISQQAEGIKRDIDRIRGEIQRQQGRGQQLAQRHQAALEQAAALEKQLEDKRADGSSLQQALEALQQARRDAEAEMADIREQSRRREEENGALTQDLQNLREQRYKLEVAATRLEAEIQAFHDRLWNEYELSYANALPLRREDYVPGAGSQQIGRLRQQMREMGEVNVGSIELFKQVTQRRDALTLQREDLRRAEADLEKIIGDLKKVMEQQFLAQFSLINQHFGETFSELFGGGRAELKLSDPSDPLGCDIQIIAQPPGKKLQMISLLSGGEKALTAIAILFAILRLKPTPFCLLDEIEAPLDEANAVLFARFLRDYAQRTQFVMITHRKETMERCDVLYGVAMEEKGVSKMVSVRMADMSA